MPKSAILATVWSLVSRMLAGFRSLLACLQFRRVFCVCSLCVSFARVCSLCVSFGRGVCVSFGRAVCPGSLPQEGAKEVHASAHANAAHANSANAAPCPHAITRSGQFQQRGSSGQANNGGHQVRPV